MPAPQIRYPLDPTGVNPDNYISNELKTLNVAPIRAVAPAYGPFFTDSIVVRDAGTGAVLVKGTDYKIVDLLQSATLKFGKEIAQVVLIINSNIGSQVRLSYQALGGMYQSNSEGLVQLYEAVLDDARPIDWTQVLNKPATYTPTLHTHLLEDVYGFEPVVVELERIRNALVLSDVPAFEALIDWVKSNAANTIFTDPPIPFMTPGEQKVIRIYTTNARNEAKYYWSIQHETTTDSNFIETSGVIQIFQNRSQFTLKMAPGMLATNRTFSVIIRKDRIDGPIATTIEGISFIRSNGDAMSVLDLINTCCIMEPRVSINPISFFLAGE